MTPTTALIGPSAVPAALPLAVPALACGMDRHLGPYDALPELVGFLGAEWCRCRRCGSPITRATARRNAA